MEDGIEEVAEDEQKRLTWDACDAHEAEFAAKDWDDIYGDVEGAERKLRFNVKGFLGPGVSQMPLVMVIREFWKDGKVVCAEQVFSSDLRSIRRQLRGIGLRILGALLGKAVRL
jgi:hypothetical protein